MPQYVTKPGESTVAQSKLKVKRPPMFRVLMHNDDYTTMEFVVEVLHAIYAKPIAEAVEIMLSVHRKGIGVCGVFTHEIAETKIAQTHDRARNSGYPLMCSMEPAD